MKDLKRSFSSYFKKLWPIFVIVLVVLIFFWKVWLKGLIPIPGDFVVGTYFPWLDYKWGYDVGVPVKNPITSDVVSVIYPLRSFAVDQIKSGHFPLWNPLMFAGYPLVGNFQAGIFSPTFPLYLILPKLTAWSLQVILQPLLAALFSYLFLRSIKLSKQASVLGGLVYAFSGFNIIWLEWNAHSLGAAFIPAQLFFVSRFIESKKIKWLAGLSLAVVLQMFAGYPQLVIYSFIAIFLFLLFQAKKLKLRKHFLVLIFLFLGIVLSAIQTLPSYELLSNSQRSAEVLSEDLSYLPWQNLISLFVPDYFGNHATGNFWGMGNYTNNVGYTGIAAFILATVGFLYFRKKKVVWFLASIFLISLLFSLPFPWSMYIRKFGFLGIGASSNTRILVLANLAIAILSAFGLDVLLNKDKKNSSIVPAIFLPSLVLSIVYWRTYAKYQVTMNEELLVGLRNLILPIAITLVMALLLFMYTRLRNKKLKLLFSVATSAIVVLELFRFGWKYTPFSQAELVFPQTPVIKFLEEQETPFRISEGDTIPMNMWVPYEFEALSGYDAAYPLRIAKYIAITNSGNPRADPYGRHGSVVNANSPLFDLANIKYILTLKRDSVGDPDPEGEVSSKYPRDKFEKIFEDGSVAILKNKTALERIFFVSDWVVTENEVEAFQMLIDDEFDLKRQIVLEKEFGGLDKNNSIPEYSINILEEEPNKLSLDINSNQDGFLVITNTYYPGWSVFVDGQKEEILVADFTFRAVPVKKGIHKLEFLYEPKSFKIGKWISFATLILLSGLIIHDNKKNGRRPSQKRAT